MRSMPVPLHLPWRRHMATAKLRQGPLSTAAVVLAIVALVLASTAFAQESSDSNQTGQSSQQAYTMGTKSLNVSDANELINELAAAQDAGYSRVEIILPPRALFLSSPLKVKVAAHFRGASTKNVSNPSQLKCGSDSMTSLIDFSGSDLRISGVHLQDCACPGLNISSMGPSKITIEDCVFSNFTRILDSTRVNLFAPDAPASVSSSTAALAIHAGGFSGTLSIIGSNFTGNRFIRPVEGSPVSRRLYAESLTSDAQRVLGARPRGREEQSQPRIESMSGLTMQSKRRKQRGLLSAPVSDVQADVLSGDTAEDLNLEFLAEPHRRVLEQSSESQYWMPFLQSASNIHPGLQAGPWADDMEAVVAIICNGYAGERCSIALTKSVISDNCGVATSGLYVLCDNATACDVDLQSCTVTNNSLLWQQAAYLNDLSFVEDRGLWNAQDYSDEGPGISLLMSMVPWMTYTYPLLEYFRAASRQEFVDFKLLDTNIYPRLTGRTLGAIVLHQRNSPPVGSFPSSAAMMRVRVTGGIYNGNDGTAIMSTATDFMTMAGSNGTWNGGPPRHSADIQITDMVVSEHNSGFPAVWLRWARNVNITRCQVSNSTGAVWLDEIRDLARIVNSSFIGNKLNHLWLDPLGFIALPQIDIQNDMGVPNLGAGASHVVKVQMTTLGGVPNYVTIQNCQFKGNPSFTSGVLYIRASDKVIINKDDQPGATQLTISDTDFVKNTCMPKRTPGNCVTAERSLAIRNVYSVLLLRCRFMRNGIGGASFNNVHAATINGDTTFDSNQLTCTLNDGMGDNYYGGAGVVATNMGSGGIWIANTTFMNNTAAIGGGAVHIMYFDSAGIRDCRFEGNTAETFDGGALWLQDGSIGAELQGNTFDSNTAGRNGGAVAAINLAPTSTTGLSLSKSVFVNNIALIKPAARGPYLQDQAGGGAIFASGSGTMVMFSTFVGNKVLGHAGGALRIVDSTYLYVMKSTFENNVAIMGGAIAASRLSRLNRLHNAVFKNNTVVDPWAWPDTSPVKPSSVEPLAIPSPSFIDPGYGGAVYLYSASLQMYGTGMLIGNSAKFGGAMAIISCPGFSVMSSTQSEMDGIPIDYISVPPAVAQAAGLQSASSRTTLPYRYLFSENTALIGGALYVFDTDSTTMYSDFFQSRRTAARPVQTAESIALNNQPAILFYRNLANGGGAVHLDGNGQMLLRNCRFVANNASTPPLFANYSGLYGRERDYATAKAHPCYGGGGGGMCIVGQAGKNLTLRSSDFIANTAKDGAGIYLAEGLDCIDQAGCYQMVLDSVNMTDNNAINRGGAVFWTHEGILQVASCPSDMVHKYKTDGRILISLSNNLSAVANASQQQLYNITLVFPKRKGPSQWYGQLLTTDQQRLLAPVGGPTLSTALKVVNGALVSAGVIYAKTIAQNATITVNGQLVGAKGAVLTRSGDVIVSSETTSSDEQAVAEGKPVVINGSIVYDAGWLGVPYTSLPCQSWVNMANTGSDISTTPYFLTCPSQLKFYTSNTEIMLSVTVRDWFGQPCLGDSSTQPLVIVQANSTEVSGAVMVPASNGTSEFTSLRLRATEGRYNIRMAGQLYTPVRELLSATVQIYVRPCAINEFLSPKNLDECIPCELGTYNLNVSAVSCLPCPDNAACAFPDPAACKEGVECRPSGFMVPDDGYWHANFFSEELLECPNLDSCTFSNRSDILSVLQLQIWNETRKISMIASDSVANITALEVLSRIVSSRDSMRRLLQEKALTDDENTLRILQSVITLMPQYAQSQCAEGYTGTLCGECLPGYGWRQVATCNKCPQQALNNLYYALVTLLTLSTLAFTIYSSLKDQEAPGRLVGGMGDKDKRRGNRASDNGAPNSPPLGAGGMLPAPTGSFPGLEQVLASSIGYSRKSDILAASSNRSYMHPVVAAARGHFSSAPTASRGHHASSMFAQAPFATYDTAMRSHSARGTPINGNRARLGRIENANRNILIPTAGPVAESTGYTNVLFEVDRRPQIDNSGSDSDSENEVHTGAENGCVAPAQVPSGIMMQSVPVMQSSPPGSVRQHDIASSPVIADPQPVVELQQQPRSRSKSAPRKRAEPSTIIKIFVSYIQVLALLQNVPLDIPGVLDVYYRINNQAISYPGTLVSLDCSLPDMGISKAIIRVLLTVLAPFYLWIGAMLYFLVFDYVDYHYIMPYLAKRKTKKRRRRRQLRMPTFGIHMEVFLRRQLIVTFITIFFFFYPSVVQSLMTVFNCKAVNSSFTTNPLALGLGLHADKVWSQDFGLSCYEGRHKALTFGLGVPGVVLLALGWPIMNALFMTGKLPFLNSISFTEEMTNFFLADFKSKYTWWESVVMVRKLLIAVVVTLMDGPTSAGVQLLLVVCILVIAMSVHFYSMPYHFEYTNYLEMASLITLLMTLYFSLYFSCSSFISNGSRVGISILILVINIVMVLVFVYYIIQAYWYSALHKTGLTALDAETRRRLTPAEIEKKILENLASQASTAASVLYDSGPREQNTRNRVASIYAAAFWASMRVNSTTSKMITRMRTVVDKRGDAAQGDAPATKQLENGADHQASKAHELDPEAGQGAVENQGPGRPVGGDGTPVKKSASMARRDSPDAATNEHPNPPSATPSGGSSVPATGQSANSEPTSPAQSAVLAATRESSSSSDSNPRLSQYAAGMGANVGAPSPSGAVSPSAVSPVLSPRPIAVRSQSKLDSDSTQSAHNSELPPPPPALGFQPSQQKP